MTVAIQCSDEGLLKISNHYRLGSCKINIRYQPELLVPLRRKTTNAMELVCGRDQIRIILCT